MEGLPAHLYPTVIVPGVRPAWTDAVGVWPGEPLNAPADPEEEFGMRCDRCGAVVPESDTMMRDTADGGWLLECLPCWLMYRREEGEA
jgi:hypothetical protein